MVKNSKHTESIYLLIEIR